MELGTNEEDFLDEIEDFEEEPSNEEQTEEQVQEPDESSSIEEDFVSVLLKSRGIEDKSKVKFETEDGTIEEIDWDNLSNEDKLNIINSSVESENVDLDESESQLIATIRNSGMTPAEYIQYIENSGVERYIQNSQQDAYQYTVDQYTDDELFVADFLSRMGDVTDEEAQEALERAKSNETLFKKQIQALRNEYKGIEEENIRQAQIQQEQVAQEQFNQFADITNYFQKEITQVRQQSYQKGLEDAKVKNKSSVVYKQKGKAFEEYADLDDF